MANRSWRGILTIGGLLAATTLVVLLGREVRSLRAEARLENQREQYMLTGMYVPRLELSTPDGRLVVIGEPEIETREVLFIRDPRCDFSRANVPVWNEIAEATQQRPYTAYALSLNGGSNPVQYPADHSLQVETLLVKGERAKTLLRTRTVPQTMVVDPDGLVVLARPGVLFPDMDGLGIFNPEVQCYMCATR